ncbi:hypothetical protein NMY22_g18688 [Coprinellus aureogranulatus]|nr:hypothetical protein NMY22_g18688 [Coprinellus aureogranulatus]
MRLGIVQFKPPTEAAAQVVPPPPVPVVAPPAPPPALPLPAPSESSSDEDDSDNEDSDDSDLGGYGEVNNFAGSTSSSALRDPPTYAEAMKRADSMHWHNASVQEIITLEANGTWEIVDLPVGAKAIPSGWVFKTKHTYTGEIERYKGRVVAKGCNQRPGIDYTDTFAPTFRPAAFRAALATAGIEDMHLRSIDFSSAFTNGDLKETIYMRQPEGFHVGGPNC